MLNKLYTSGHEIPKKEKNLILNFLNKTLPDDNEIISKERELVKTINYALNKFEEIGDKEAREKMREAESSLLDYIMILKSEYFDYGCATQEIIGEFNLELD